MLTGMVRMVRKVEMEMAVQPEHSPLGMSTPAGHREALWQNPYDMKSRMLMTTRMFSHQGGFSNGNVRTKGHHQKKRSKC